MLGAGGRDLPRGHAVLEDAGSRFSGKWLDGLPVLLIGGLAAPPQTLFPLRNRLSHAGCRVEIARAGAGLDCGERSAQAVTRAAERLAETSGEPCALVGHSRGGQFARAVAVRRPDLVRGLVTLGTPLNRIVGVHPLLKAELACLGFAGALGVPGVMRPSCLWGTCCERYRADLGSAIPPDVGFLSMYSRSDRLVDWRHSLDPAARHREVATTHSGFLTSPEVFAALVDELTGLFATHLVSAAVA